MINFTYTHTTKEVIQLLKYSHSSIDEQKQILDERHIVGGMSVEKFNRIKKLCENATTLLIEISSIKEYKNEKGYYYNQWTVRDNIIEADPELYNKITISTATLEDLIHDIEAIKGLLPNSTIIFQSHINLDFEGMVSLNANVHVPPIKSRELLDTAINATDGVLKLIPRDIFKGYDWRKIVLSKNDTCHFSVSGYRILATALDNLL